MIKQVRMWRKSKDRFESELSQYQEDNFPYEFYDLAWNGERCKIRGCGVKLLMLKSQRSGMCFYHRNKKEIKKRRNRHFADIIRIFRSKYPEYIMKMFLSQHRRKTTWQK